MAENLPTRTDGAMPYIKPRDRGGTGGGRRRGNGFRTFTVVLIIVGMLALTFVVYRSVKTFVGSFKSEKTTENDTTTEAPRSTTGGTASEAENVRSIIKKDMSAAILGKDYENEAGITIEEKEYTAEKISGNEIAVLVICSRGYETYLENSVESITGDYPGGEETVLVDSAAKTLATALAMRGVGALYVDVGNTSAYGSTARVSEMLSELLESYKGVKYIIDIRRGVYTDENGALVSPEFSAGEDACAQIRFTLSAKSGNFEAEKGIADALFSSLAGKERHGVMPTRIKDSAGISCGACVISAEIGSAVTSKAAALRGAALLGEAVADILRE